MTDDLNLELKVGSILHLEDEHGNVTAWTVKQIAASLPAFGPDWVTTSPGSGLVRLTLSAES